MSLDQAQLDMARTMYGEARGEGDQGMRAVAHVIVNRANLGGWWGDSVREVVHKPWQFSTWNEGDPNWHLIKDRQPGEGDPTFDRAFEIAGEVLAGTSWDPTGGATHYHATYVDPAWADPDKRTAFIGNHVFYKGIG